MITVAPVLDKEEIKKYYEKANIGFSVNSGCVLASSGSEVLGFCLYELTDKSITVVYIEPKDDLALVDGILRSTLHIAASRSIMDARYSGVTDETLFDKLGFILDKNEKKLNIDKLFTGCNCKSEDGR